MEMKSWDCEEVQTIQEAGKRNGGIRFYGQLECCAVTEEVRTNSNAVGHLVGGWLPSLIVQLLVPAIFRKHMIKRVETNRFKRVVVRACDNHLEKEVQ